MPFQTKLQPAFLTTITLNVGTSMKQPHILLLVQQVERSQLNEYTAGSAEVLAVEQPDIVLDREAGTVSLVEFYR